MAVTFRLDMWASRMTAFAEIGWCFSNSIESFCNGQKPTELSKNECIDAIECLLGVH